MDTMVTLHLLRVKIFSETIMVCYIIMTITDSTTDSIDLIKLLTEITCNNSDRTEYNSTVLNNLGYVCDVDNSVDTLLIYVNEDKKKIIVINDCIKTSMINQDFTSIVEYLLQRNAKTKETLYLINNKYIEYTPCYIGYSLGSILFNTYLSDNKHQFITYSGLFIKPSEMNVTNYAPSSDWTMMINKTLQNDKMKNIHTTLLDSDTNWFRQLIHTRGDVVKSLAQIHGLKCVKEKDYPIIIF